MENYNMSKREIDQVEIFTLLKKGHIKQKEAADILDLSVRQIRRKLRDFRANGPVGLKHKNRGKKSNRKIQQEMIQKILSLVQTRYSGFGPTFAAEKLLSEYQIEIDHETLRKIMVENGLHKPKSRKSNKYFWREPKHHKGEMVQLDGSDHIWFGDQRCTLIVFIDDATKEVFCRFAPESTIGVSEALLLYLKKHGRPIKFYTDKGKVFKVNNGKNRNAKTQFCRMLDELNIKIKFAYSPQAKGRVERVNRTLQDRLVKELKLLNITNIDDANAMLDSFLKEFNKKFMVQAKSSESLFRSLDGYDLNTIFCYKYKRILNNDNIINYKNRYLLLDAKQQVLIRPKNSIDIYQAFDGTISLYKNGHKLHFKEINKPQKLKEEKIYNNNPKVIKPPKNHPWRNYPKEDISIESKIGHF